MKSKHSFFDDIENPWADISWDNPIAACDQQAIADFNKKVEAEELRVDQTMLPEPFTGDLETANLVCLNLNPGKSNDDALFKHHRRLLELTQQTLKHQLGYSMWFEEIKTDKGKLHPGCKWWRSHTQSLLEKLGHDQNEAGKNLKMFVLEFFPYHTRKASVFPRLESDRYRDRLLDYAIDHRKLIVIMRARNLWFQIPTEVNDLDSDRKIPLGEKLKKYENILYILNPRSPYIAENNLISPGDFAKNWETLTNTLRG